MSTRLDIGDGTGLDKLVNRLVETPPAKPKTLEPLPPVAPIDAQRGTGKAAAPPTRGSAVSTGGAWTETSRETWPDRIVQSTDGLFTWVTKPIKKVSFTDGATGVMELNFLNPP